MSWDAVVVGSGPNGLAAAIEMARSGASVLVLEAAGEVGGGTRSAELTEPGFIHDVCSAVHPLAASSPFFRSLPLRELGIELVHPVAPLAHPLEASVAFLERDLDATAAGLGGDGSGYRNLFAPLVERATELTDLLLAPPRRPRDPRATISFLWRALRSAQGLAGSRLGTDEGRALFGGIAAHSMLALDRVPSAAFGLFLGMLGHSVGWPVVRGGSGRIAAGLAAHLRALGGSLETGRRVASLEELPEARVVLLDLVPQSVAEVAGSSLPARYLARLRRRRRGPGVFKVDWALEAPIPWARPDLARAGTVHLGGSLPAIVAAEAAVARGVHPERPFVILVQPSLFDDSRAPGGKQVAWAYCHVPNGSRVDMTAAIESQIDRWAPGFRDVVIARSTLGPEELAAYNRNYRGGDINGGAQSLARILTGPAPRWDPYSTPNPRLFLCSSATPPGAGVHGMCGYHAARSALGSLGLLGRRPGPGAESSG